MVTVEKVTELEQLYEKLESEEKWASIFHNIRSSCQSFEYTDTVAKQMANRALNRYRDVNPFDHSRVKLQQRRLPSDQHHLLSPPSDYINASLVCVPEAGRRYILAQGPLSNTTGHFWLMVWQQNTTAVIMLNRVIEKNQLKCHQYWPLQCESAAGDCEMYSMVMDDVGLSVENRAIANYANYTVSTIKLTDVVSGESRDIHHFHYTTWPDFGVPASAEAFLAFLHAVRASGALCPAVGPAIVHCSAGIGRSGTFCLVDSFLVLLEAGCAVSEEAVTSLLLSMRHHRAGLIQTPGQLSFSFMAIVEAARNLLHHSTLCDLSKSDLAEQSTARVNGAVSASSLCDSPPPPLPPRRLVSLSGQREKSETDSDSRSSNVSSPPSGNESPSPTVEHPAPLSGPPTPPPHGDCHSTMMSDVNQGYLWQRRSRKQQLEQKLAEIRRRQLQCELSRRRRDQLRPLLYTAAALGVAFLSYMLVHRWMTN